MKRTHRADDFGMADAADVVAFAHAHVPAVTPRDLESYMLRECKPTWYRKEAGRIVVPYDFDLSRMPGHAVQRMTVLITCRRLCRTTPLDVRMRESRNRVMQQMLSALFASTPVHQRKSRPYEEIFVMYGRHSLLGEEVPMRKLCTTLEEMSGDLCGTYVLDPQTSPFVPRDGIQGDEDGEDDDLMALLS